MVTSSEQLTSAITALNAAADAYNGKKAQIDLALANFTKSVRETIGTEMLFGCTLDPDYDGVLPDLTYLNFADVLSAAPSMAGIVIDIPAGAVVEMVGDYNYYGMMLHFRCVEAGPRPQIIFRTSADGSYNELSNVLMRFGGWCLFENVDVQLEGKADEAKEWRFSRRAAVRGKFGSSFNVGVYNCSVTGADATSNFMVLMHRSTVVHIMADSTTVDTITLVQPSTEGLANIAAVGVTLTNGGRLYDEALNVVSANVVEAV